MPWKKPKPKPFESVEQMLLANNINAPGLAKILNVTAQTARRKLNEPSKLTLSDIGRINRYGHIDWNTIQQSIKE